MLNAYEVLNKLSDKQINMLKSEIKNRTLMSSIIAEHRKSNIIEQSDYNLACSLNPIINIIGSQQITNIVSKNIVRKNIMKYIPNGYNISEKYLDKLTMDVNNLISKI